MSTPPTPYSTLPNTPTIPITPYKITAPDPSRDSLSILLQHTRLPKPTFENTQKTENLGLKRDWLVSAVDQWKGIEWKAWEQRMNEHPQFMGTVLGSDGREYDVHFMALFSSRADAKPLVFMHGWPGCFLEFMGMLRLVRERWGEGDLPYHIIVPSLPGWAYSTPPPTDHEFAVKDISYIIDGLMRGLGFPKYIAQGGDIGSFVAVDLAVRHDACAALHVNFRKLPGPPEGTPEHAAQAGKTPSPDEIIDSIQQFGYALEHATRPATVGFVVGCNPVSLLAWIGEKYLEWSDESPSTQTILDIATLYWLTDTYPSSIYTYRYGFGAHRHDTDASSESAYIPKPLGYSLFKYEIAPTPVHWVEQTGNMVWSREHQQGGHFAALERPEDLWKDVEEFVDKAWDMPPKDKQAVA